MFDQSGATVQSHDFFLENERSNAHLLMMGNNPVKFCYDSTTGFRENARTSSLAKKKKKKKKKKKNNNN